MNVPARIRSIGRSIGVCLILPVLLGACGKSSSSTGPSSNNALLFELNAQFNGGRTVRWPGLPIPVSLNGVGTADEVSAWTSATSGRVTFVFVGSGGGAIIRLHFRSGTDVCGSTTVEFTDDGVITSADVNVSQAIFRGPQCVRTVTHEVGHALGVLSHTSDGGLMDVDGGNGEFTSGLTQMVRDLYSLSPGTVVSAERVRTAPLRRSGGRNTMTFVHPVRR